MSDSGAIYIHIPFCVQKCIYCDFYSKTDLSLIPPFIQALIQEIKKRAYKFASYPFNFNDKIDTIYFGGGTPSLLSINEVDLLLQTIKETFSILSDAEISFEINPETVDFNYLKELRNIGINRLSIGVQSFNHDKLEFLKRIHTADQAINAVEDAKKAGFLNISLDMIYAVPFETTKLLMQDLKKAAKMEIVHLSCYMLTIEPLTPLDKKVKQKFIEPLDRRTMAILFKETVTRLYEFGFEHYEISNFSKGKAYRSEHNSKYWDIIPYLGFGPGAHSLSGDKRTWNHKSIRHYIKDIISGRLPVKGFEILDIKQKKLETIMLSLRTLEGIDIKKYNTQFNTDFQKEFKEVINSVLDSSYGFLCSDSFALNLEGKTCLNNIVEAFAQKIL